MNRNRTDRDSNGLLCDPCNPSVRNKNKLWVGKYT